MPISSAANINSFMSILLKLVYNSTVYLIDGDVKEFFKMATFPGGSGSVPANVVTQDSITGALQVSGVNITGTIPVTIAQFLVLDPADYIGAELLIEDIPIAHSLYNGVAVRANAAGTGWIWMQTPSFTRATVPTAAQASGWRIFVSDIGNRGSFWYSNGTRYNLDQAFVVLSNITSSIAITGTPTAATVAKQVTLPLIDGKNIWGDGDILEVFNYGEKTGTADILHAGVYIGQNTRVLNDSETNTLVTTYGPTAAGIGVTVTRRILRKSATSVRSLGSDGVPANGGAAGTKSTDVTISSLDTATSYVDATLRLGTSTGDSALTLAAHTVTLIQAGAA